MNWYGATYYAILGMAGGPLLIRLQKSILLFAPER